MGSKMGGELIHLPKWAPKTVLTIAIRPRSEAIAPSHGDLHPTHRGGEGGEASDLHRGAAGLKARAKGHWGRQGSG